MSKAPPQVESGVMGVDIGGFLIFFLIIEVLIYRIIVKIIESPHILTASPP